MRQAAFVIGTKGFGFTVFAISQDIENITSKHTWKS